MCFMYQSSVVGMLMKRSDSAVARIQHDDVVALLATDTG